MPKYFEFFARWVDKMLLSRICTDAHFGEDTVGLKKQYSFLKITNDVEKQNKESNRSGEFQNTLQKDN